MLTLTKYDNNNNKKNCPWAWKRSGSLLNTSGFRNFISKPCCDFLQIVVEPLDVVAHCLNRLLPRHLSCSRIGCLLKEMLHLENHRQPLYILMTFVFKSDHNLKLVLTVGHVHHVGTVIKPGKSLICATTKSSCWPNYDLGTTWGPVKSSLWTIDPEELKWTVTQSLNSYTFSKFSVFPESFK